MSKVGSLFKRHCVEFLVHLFTWAFIFISPLFFHPGFNLAEHIHSFIFPIVCGVIFYINYWGLVPFYYQKREYADFVFLNTFCILFFMGVSICIREAYPQHLSANITGSSTEEYGTTPQLWWFTLLRNLTTYIFIVAITIFIRLSKTVKQMEIARKQAEVEHKEAELRNLRNQINPHFLLNTLNNIYALTRFDVEKAQTAILELSTLLRYILYENEEEEVSIQKEVEFLKNYIALMQIRSSDKVTIDAQFNIAPHSTTTVAPLIFISLVENAFKHGISSTRSSFIRVYLEESDNIISFSCENSFFPKKNDDKSPGGIGLQQVARRLDLSYLHHYSWVSYLNEDQSIYTSKIKICKATK